MPIVIKDLAYSYGRRKVLRDLNWDIPDGTTGLIGPNGAGKSTLIKCLTGITSPQSGSITFSSRDGATPDTGARRVGYVPQEAKAPPRMPVTDVIEYCAWLNGTPNVQCAARAREAIELLDLGELRTRRFGTLSGGERRRVMIATGLAHRPGLLVLDEPTVGLDPGQRLAVRRAIASLEGIEGVLIATHIVEDVEFLCTNVGVLHEGRIGFSGPTARLLARVGESASDGPRYGSRFEQAYEGLLEGLPDPDGAAGGRR